MRTDPIKQESMPKVTAGNTKRLELCNVDLVRGLAAIAILFWHYQHFFLVQHPGSIVGAEIQSQPFYWHLRPIYDHGHTAVQLFWVLSGFIFFYVYGSRRNVSSREFWTNRFSRLYPLHFATLILVAALQLVNVAVVGRPLIYLDNTLGTFVVNLFFTQSIFTLGTPSQSFNAPTWSLSIELTAYVVFFAIVKWARWRELWLFVWLVVALIVYTHSGVNSRAELISLCAFLFVLGGAVQIFVFALKTRKQLIAGAVLATAVAIGSIYLASQSGPVDGVDVVSCATFPAVLAIAAILDRLNISSGSIGRYFGNITYSTYLIHVPIQLLILLTLHQMNRTANEFAPQLWFMLIYLALVVGSATLTYKWFELPAKNYLRNKLNPRRLPAAKPEGAQ